MEGPSHATNYPSRKGGASDEPRNTRKSSDKKIEGPCCQASSRKTALKGGLCENRMDDVELELDLGVFGFWEPPFWMGWFDFFSPEPLNSYFE